MAPEEYKEHNKAKDRARKHKGGGGGAKKGGAVKGSTPLLESRDECTGKELLRLCKLFTQGAARAHHTASYPLFLADQRIFHRRLMQCGYMRGTALQEGASARRGCYWAALEASYSPIGGR